MVLDNLRVGFSAPVWMSPTAAGTTLALRFTVGPKDTVELDLNGVRQWLGIDFTVSDSTVTFLGTGYAAGDQITARKLFITGAT